MGSVHQPNDKGYKSILEHKQTFLELLQSFVKESWVKEIEEDNLEYVNKSFILKDYKDKEADIVYRLKIKDKEVIFYVLLELQSAVDYTMPFRMLVYMTEIWRQEFYNTGDNVRERKDYKLPGIVPIVLYNGEGQWTASTSFKEMQAGNELFSNHLLDFNYILLSINSYTEEELLGIGNMISSVFLLDQKFSTDQFIPRFYKLVNTLKRLSPEKWIRFKQWIKLIVIANFSGSEKEYMNKIIDEADIMEVEEMVSNLEIALDEALSKSRNEGKAEGKVEGERQGKLEVARKALTRGLAIEVIVEITGLSVEQIKDIHKEIIQ